MKWMESQKGIISRKKGSGIKWGKENEWFCAPDVSADDLGPIPADGVWKVRR